jgi:hypothetical protein
MSVCGAIITPQADTANTIASFFSLVCSSDNYDSSFSVIKDSAETLPLNFTLCVTEPYNTTFSMDKLLAALELCCSMSPGPNGIHNEMRCHLPLAGKDFVLSMYNHIWTESLVPDAWRETTVIPVPKPSRDRSLETS